MEFKYTSGPWKLEHGCIYGKNGSYITRDIGNGENYICRMDGSTMASVHKEGNARLIAAAPELYEALKLLESTCGEGWLDINNPIREYARYTLQKASGDV